MRSPDAAWLSLEKWNALSPEDQERYAPVCPEFIIELRSPFDSLPELERKMHQWISNRAELAWLIDPLEQAVTIYRPHRSPERQRNGTEVVGEGPVEGFVLSLRRIFAPLQGTNS